MDLEAYITTAEITAVQAMEKIDKGARGILFVVDQERRLIGCVTDGDIRRWLIRTADLSAAVEAFMFSPPKFLPVRQAKDADAYMEKLVISALPLVDDQMRVLDIRFRILKKEDEKPFCHGQLEGVPVVLMAGGKGTRLYPYTKVLPKPLIPIGGVPILERILSRFQSFGVRDFMITVNYKKGMIKSYFDELQPDYRIQYIEEDRPLGTGGSLKLIPQKMNRPLFVSNSDILINADLADIYQQHMDSGNQVTVVSSLKKIEVPYGVLRVKEGGVIEGMDEKPRLSYFINTGMYVINPDMIDLIPRDTVFHMTDLVEQALRNGCRVGMYPVSEDKFLDMGEFEEMKRMEEKLGNN